MSEVREGYKITELGEVPKDWSIENITNLVEKITDGTHKKPTYVDKGIPFLRVVDIQSAVPDWKKAKYISEDEHNELIKRCHPEKGDILLSKNGTIGIVKIVDWEQSFSIYVSLCLIKLKKFESKISPLFIKYILESPIAQNQFAFNSKQGTVTNLHLVEIKKLTLPVPSIKEQQKIADILSTVDTQIEKTEQMIEQTKELKHGLMQQLLTKGIGHKEFKESELGEIPVSWNVLKLDELIKKIIGGGTPSRKKEIYYTGDIPWITVKDMQGAFYQDYSLEHITSDAIKESACNLIEKNNVIIATRIALGKAFINTKSVAINQDLKALYLSNKIINEYFLYSYLYKAREIEALGSGSTVKGIRLEQLKEIKFVIPPIEEQQKIAEILSSVDDQIDIYEKEKEKYEELKKGLMQQLLTGKIRVKVDE